MSNRCTVIEADISSAVESEAYDSAGSISMADIKSAVSRLKPLKKDGCPGLLSDHLINAGEDMFGHIALLFNAIVAHGRLHVRFL